MERREQIRILMVCLGNICRSPMAQGLLEHKIKQEGLPVDCDSAGTSGYHTGENPDLRAQKTMRLHGIDISSYRARQFTSEDFFRFDKIYVMDQQNYEDVLSLAPKQEDVKKVDFLLNLIFPGENMSVPDPYWGGEQGFEDVFRLLDDATSVLIKDIKRKVFEKR
jgi:protein-tyrosine phosphatase